MPKILVHCQGREVRACTGRVFDGEGNVHLRYRQFEPIGKSNKGRAYMTIAEAEFLVESEENRAHADANLEPPFEYPSGYPAPVADNYKGRDGFGGALTMPLTDKSFHVSDARQVTKAVGLLAERDAAMSKAATEKAKGTVQRDAQSTLTDTLTQDDDASKSDSAQTSRRGLE
jgi:hypothetical protein